MGTRLRHHERSQPKELGEAPGVQNGRGGCTGCKKHLRSNLKTWPKVYTEEKLRAYGFEIIFQGE